MSHEPTPTEIIVAELTHTARAEYIGAAKLVSVRLHLNNFTALSSMATEAEVSRSQMHNQLLAAGIDAVMKSLPEETREHIESMRIACLKGMVQRGELEVYGEEDES